MKPSAGGRRSAARAAATPEDRFTAREGDPPRADISCKSTPVDVSEAGSRNRPGVERLLRPGPA